LSFHSCSALPSNKPLCVIPCVAISVTYLAQIAMILVKASPVNKIFDIKLQSAK